MIVHVGGILHSYTGGRSRVECRGGTVGAVLKDLERQFPGSRFRVVDEQDEIRPHIKVFVGEREVRDLGASIGSGEELHVLGALSGG